MVYKFKRLCIIFISIMTIFTTVSLADENIDDNEIFDIEEIVMASNEVNEEPKLNSRAAVIFDRTSGKVIYGKEENTRRPMASTTKVMTAIVVLENANLSDIVEVSKKAAGTGGSSLGIKTGDKVTVHDLLYGLMLVSGNDSAVALAEHIGGSVQGFAEMMNKKAKDMGLKDSSFVTPHGLDMPEHYTTAYELAVMTDYALDNKKFAEIVNTKDYTVTINGYTKTLSNTNELLGSLNGVNGVKTGFTNGANRCIVTSVKREDMNIITVVLGADTKKFRTSDSVKLIEYAYKNYKVIDIKEIIEENFDHWKNINQGRIKINKGKLHNIELQLEQIKQEYLPIKKEDERKLQIEIDCLDYLEAPVYQSQIIGRLQVKIEDKELISLDIISSKEIEKRNSLDYFNILLRNYTHYIEMSTY